MPTCARARIQCPDACMQVAFSFQVLFTGSLARPAAAARADWRMNCRSTRTARWSWPPARRAIVLIHRVHAQDPPCRSTLTRARIPGRTSENCWLRRVGELVDGCAAPVRRECTGSHPSHTTTTPTLLVGTPARALLNVGWLGAAGKSPLGAVLCA